MLMAQDKVANKDTKTVTEVVKNFANAFAKLQESDANLKKELEDIKIENASEVAYGDKRCYLVQVSGSNLKNIQSAQADIVPKLEQQFSTPVMIVPSRKRINGNIFRKYRGTKVPRDKTLTAVFDAYLEDLLYPATIVGKRIRYPQGKVRQFKVMVDPLDQEAIGYKTPAISACYKALTNRDLTIEFPASS
jgi:small subunit ribosomal protein S7e